MTLRAHTEFEGATKPHSIAIDGYEPLLSAARIVGINSDQQELVDITDGTIIYIGTACSGFATTSGVDNDSSQPNWMIQKITIASPLFNTQIGWGRWSNRSGLTYS